VARFPVFADNHVRQQIVEGLRSRGWDVLRAVDVFGEKNDDAELMAYAAREGRVFVTNDAGIHAIAHRWLGDGWAFRMAYWKARHLEKMSDGDIIHALEEIAAKPDAFAYPIEYIKPKR
jgi:hypothetical protein